MTANSKALSLLPVLVLALAPMGRAAGAYPDLNTAEREIGGWLQQQDSKQKTQDNGQNGAPPIHEYEAVGETNVHVEALRVTVSNTTGKILDLGPKNFHVYECGLPKQDCQNPDRANPKDGWVQQQYPVPLFNSEEQPLTLGIVLDNSGSMGVRKKDDETGKWNSKKNVVIVSLKALFQTINPEDEIFPVSFNNDITMYSLDDDASESGDKAKIVSDDAACKQSSPESSDDENHFVKTSDELQSFLEGVEPHGRTVLYDAIYASAEYAKKNGTMRAVRDGKRVICKPRKKALLVITDGEDFGSKMSFERAKRIAQQNEVAVYAIALPDPESPDHGQDASVLKTLTQATGGIALFPDSTSRKSLEKACRDIAQAMRNQYILGYYPTNADRTRKPGDGSWRKVAVKAFDTHGPLPVSSAEGYWAHQDKN